MTGRNLLVRDRLNYSGTFGHGSHARLINDYYPMLELSIDQIQYSLFDNMPQKIVIKKKLCNSISGYTYRHDGIIWHPDIFWNIKSFLSIEDNHNLWIAHRIEDTVVRPEPNKIDGTSNTKYIQWSIRQVSMVVKYTPNSILLIIHYRYFELLDMIVQKLYDKDLIRVSRNNLDRIFSPFVSNAIYSFGLITITHSLHHPSNPHKFDYYRLIDILSENIQHRSRPIKSSNYCIINLSVRISMYNSIQSMLRVLHIRQKRIRIEKKNVRMGICQSKIIRLYERIASITIYIPDRTLIFISELMFWVYIIYYFYGREYGISDF
jgi:hypothetical protein